MTPRTCDGIRGTAVMSMTPKISRTFRISRPYSSLSIAKVRYFPPFAPAAVRASGSNVFVLTVQLLRVDCSVWENGLSQVDQARHIQDDAHAAITQDRAAGDTAHGADGFAQRLDHHLLLAEQLVDEQ